MQWSEDGKIQITRKFAIGATLVIVGLALVAMFLIGMLVAEDGGGESGSAIPPTPSAMAAEQEAKTSTLSVMAAEQEAETPTADLYGADQEDAIEPTTELPAGTKTEYSTCLVRTQKSILLDIEDARFTPWPDYGANLPVWEIIRHRYVDYIGDHCRHVAPSPPATYSGTCIPRELQSFYRRHVPEGSGSNHLQAIAAEYALTVCQPSPDR